MRVAVALLLSVGIAVSADGTGPGPLPCRYTKQEGTKPVIPADNNYIFVIRATFLTPEACKTKCGKDTGTNMICKSFFYNAERKSCTLLGQGMGLETNAETGVDFYVKHCAQAGR